jgi:hypothetical protein
LRLNRYPRCTVKLSPAPSPRCIAHRHGFATQPLAEHCRSPAPAQVQFVPLASR